jgi:hypothetical protein
VQATIQRISGPPTHPSDSWSSPASPAKGGRPNVRNCRPTDHIRNAHQNSAFHQCARGRKHAENKIDRSRSGSTSRFPILTELGWTCLGYGTDGDGWRVAANEQAVAGGQGSLQTPCAVRQNAMAIGDGRQWSAAVGASYATKLSAAIYNPSSLLVAPARCSGASTPEAMVRTPRPRLRRWAACGGASIALARETRSFQAGTAMIPH